MINLIMQTEPVFDDVDTVDEITNSDSDVVSLENNIRGIDVALESIEAIQRIRNILLKQANRSTSRNSIKLAKIAVENIKTNLAVIGNVDIVSTENLSAEEAVSVSLESFSSVIKSIWETIVKTFKAILDKVRSFFKSTNTERAVAISNKNHNQVKEVLKEIEKGNIVPTTDPDARLIASPYFQSAFINLDRDPTDEDVLAYVATQLDLVSKVQHFSQELQLTSLQISQALKSMAEDYEEYQYLNDVQESLVNLYRSMFTVMQKDDCRDLNDAVLQPIGEHKRNINTSDSYVLNGFFEAGRFYVLRVNEEHMGSKDKSFVASAPYVTLFDNSRSLNKKRYTVKLNVVDLRNLELFSSNVLTLSQKIQEYFKDSRDREISTRIAHETSIANLNKIIDKFIEINDEGQMSEFMRFIRILLGNMNKITNNVLQMSIRLSNAELHARSLNGYMSGWYKASSIA